MNKRQQKKNKRKLQRETLVKQGLSTKQVNKLYGSQIDTLYQNAIKVERQRDRQNQLKKNYADLREAGFSPTDARKMRAWGRERLEEAIARAKQPLQSDLKLLVYWRDKTGFTGEVELRDLKDNYRYMDEDALLDTIEGWLIETTSQGFIGEGEVVVTSDVKSADMMYREWVKVYEGKGIRLRPVLVMLSTMLIAIYSHMEKYLFMQEFLNKLSIVNRDMAVRIANRVGMRRLT